MSVHDIALITIGFQPLFAWLGLLTILLLITTASYGYLLFKGKVRNFRNHMMLAATTLTVGLIHAVLALSTILGF